MGFLRQDIIKEIRRAARLVRRESILTSKWNRNDHECYLHLLKRKIYNLSIKAPPYELKLILWMSIASTTYIFKYHVYRKLTSDIKFPHVQGSLLFSYITGLPVIISQPAPSLPYFQRCVFCKKTGATIGCVVSRCRVVFHLPCGLENGVLNQFTGKFWSVSSLQIFVYTNTC